MTMDRRRFFHSLLGSLAFLLIGGCRRGADSSSDSSTVEDGLVSADAAENRKALAVYREQNFARLDQAIQRETQQHRMAAAAAKTAKFRAQLQLDSDGAWSSFTGKNMQTFLSLRRQAAQPHAQAVRCSICNGQGRLASCILCKNCGKCPTCTGTRQLKTGEICPTCQGKGTCFLCFGSGTMPCPFCDDGLISAEQPNPPRQLPIG